MAGGINNDYGMKLGRVVYDKEEKRTKVTQKVGELDVKEYVDNIKEAKMVNAIPYQDKLDAVDKTLQSMDLLKNKLQLVQDCASKMSNRISNFGFPPPNIFDMKKIDAPGTQDVQFRLSPNATVGSFSMTVNQLASSDMRKMTLTAASMDTPLGIDGSFTLGTASPGTTATINITPTTTLSQLQATIANLSSKTTINADLVQTSLGAAGNTYELKLKAQNTGQSIVLNNTRNTPLSSLGVAALPVNYLAGIFSATNEATPLGLSGTFTLQSSTGVAATPLIINSGMSLKDIVASINNQTSTTGILANYDYVYNDPTNTNPPQFQLKLTTVNPMTFVADPASTVMASDTGGIMTALGLNSPVTDYETLIANVTCDGTKLVSQTNLIDGDTQGVSMVQGVTISLVSASKQAFTGTVSLDTTGFERSFQDFRDSYNDFVRFYKEKTKMDLDPEKLGKAAEGADLFGNLMVQNTYQKLKSALTGQVGGLSPDFSYLSQIGFRLLPDGTLDAPTSADVKNYLGAIEKNYPKIQQLFSNTISMDNSGFSVNNLPDNLGNKFQGVPMAVSLTNTNGIITGSVVVEGHTYNASIMSTAGYINMTFDPNSELGGLELSYLGTVSLNSTVPMNLTMTQGIMAQIDGQIGQILDPSSDQLADGTVVMNGDYFKELDNLKTEKTKNKTKIEKIKKEADRIGKNMEKEFTKVYKATTQLESIMNMIESFNKTN